MCKKSQCLITIEGHFDARVKLDMAKTILFESQTPGSKDLRMRPPMRGSTVLSTSMRRISSPSICLDIDSTTHPALRRSVKGSERRPKSRHKIVPFDRGDVERCTRDHRPPIIYHTRRIWWNHYVLTTSYLSGPRCSSVMRS